MLTTEKMSLPFRLPLTTVGRSQEAKTHCPWDAFAKRVREMGWVPKTTLRRLVREGRPVEQSTTKVISVPSPNPTSRYNVDDDAPKAPAADDDEEDDDEDDVSLIAPAGTSPNDASNTSRACVSRSAPNCTRANSCNEGNANILTVLSVHIPTASMVLLRSNPVPLVR